MRVSLIIRLYAWHGLVYGSIKWITSSNMDRYKLFAFDAETTRRDESWSQIGGNQMAGGSGYPSENSIYSLIFSSFAVENATSHIVGNHQPTQWPGSLLPQKSLFHFRKLLMMMGYNAIHYAFFHSFIIQPPGSGIKHSNYVKNALSYPLLTMWFPYWLVALVSSQYSLLLHRLTITVPTDNFPPSPISIHPIHLRVFHPTFIVSFAYSVFAPL